MASGDKLSRLAGAVGKPKVRIDDPVWIAGRNEGREKMRRAVLTHLEEKYMDGSVTRNSPEARALLQLSAELAETMRNNDFGV